MRCDIFREEFSGEKKILWLVNMNETDSDLKWKPWAKKVNKPKSFQQLIIVHRIAFTNLSYKTNKWQNSIPIELAHFTARMLCVVYITGKHRINLYA